MASTQTKAADPKAAGSLGELPTAKDLMQQVALKEAEKASAAMRERTAGETEKQALLEKLSKPSGVDDKERMARATAIIKRAAGNGLTEVEVGRFPKELFTDRGRAVNQMEPGWENTLTGLPKELLEFWREFLRPHGYKLKVQVVDFPGGIPGDIGMTLSWS